MYTPPRIHTERPCPEKSSAKTRPGPRPQRRRLGPVGARSTQRVQQQQRRSVAVRQVVQLDLDAGVA
jgi:hypothetical protein